LITSDNKRMYVALFALSSVAVIDTTKNTLVDTIDLGRFGQLPIAITYDPDHKTMYVAGNDGTVSVIDTTNNEVVDTILDVHGGPYGIAYDPDNKMVYVSNAGTTDRPALGGVVAVIDTDTNKVVDRIPIIGNNPPIRVLGGIAYHPEDHRMYVSNLVENNVWAIDTTNNMVVGDPIPVGFGPTNIAYDPDHQRMYVVDSGGPGPRPSQPGAVSVITFFHG
jgi:YVTN family beta-propeller protein